MTSPDDSEIYFFLGNISSHILHALPLWSELGGTFVVTSKLTEREVRKYDVPVVSVDDIPYRWEKPGMRPKRVHEYITLDAKLKKTYDFLDTHAKIVIFYELFELKHPEWLTKPKKIFLTHGNMLKSYITMHPKRLESIAHYDYMAALSPYMKARFIANGIPEEKLIDIGIARTDDLLNKINRKPTVRKEIVEKLALNPTKPIIFYAPTFWGESSIHHTGFEILEHIDDSFTLLFRPHPQTPSSILKKYQKIISNKATIHLVDHNTDVSPADLLISSDAIIIDRSSIALEALLTDTPLIFAYDGDKQEDTSDYESIKEIVDYSQKILLGDKANVNKIIEAAIHKGIDPVTWNKVRSRTWFQSSGGATEAIKTFITSQIN